ncbi:MAG TPA: HAD family hydrolase [Clostridiales bacterium]|nr:HAD family hydrolase [Clostridiales bacterium]
MVGTVIFDMDGTLLDTLTDLHESVNALLAELSLPPRDVETVRDALGYGAVYMLKCSMPSGTTDEEAERLLPRYKEIYAVRMKNHTAPYAGVLDMLKDVKAAGFATAVVTNKLDAAAQALCAEVFGGLIDAAEGDRPDVARKPAPDHVYNVLKRLNMEGEPGFFVGDSDADIQIAKNAGLTSIGVSWGYQPVRVLLAEGADYIIDKPGELLNILNSG